ncbi:MAG TPA: IS481 family transposase, partial [Aquihabitans sp.]|nr:IS481 family transposase [Aquihabitans sp.]HEX2578574.1 IS481 family transposase [Aquihabitans sp.]
YARLWKSEAARARALDRFLHRYNHHRHHTAIGGPPSSRVTNLAGHNT